MTKKQQYSVIDVSFLRFQTPHFAVLLFFIT